MSTFTFFSKAQRTQAGDGKSRRRQPSSDSIQSLRVLAKRHKFDFIHCTLAPTTINNKSKMLKKKSKVKKQIKMLLVVRKEPQTKL